MFPAAIFTTSIQRLDNQKYYQDFFPKKVHNIAANNLTN